MANGTAFSQLALNWVTKPKTGVQITYELGHSDIKTDLTKPNGVTPLLKDYFLGAAYKWGGKNYLDFSAKIKVKDTYASAAETANETDGKEYSTKAKGVLSRWGLKHNLSTGLTSSRAKGKYQRTKKGDLSYQAEKSWAPFTLSGKYAYSQTKYDEKNPSKTTNGLKETKRLGTATLKGTYKLFARTQLVLQLTQKKQASDLETSNYSSNAAQLMVLQTF